MNKKYLIVSGDSFTEGHTMGEQASWAYWVAKKMNLELINLSCGGKGNEWISNSLLSFLSITDISLDECIVMVGWSDLSRQSIFIDLELDDNSGMTDIVIGDLMYPSDSAEHDKKLQWIYKNRKVLSPLLSSIRWCVYKTYQSLFFTKIFLESKNIPFIFFDVITDNKIYYINNKPFLKNNWKDFNSNDLEELEIDDSLDIIMNMISEKNVKYIFDQHYINFNGYPILGWLLDGRIEYEKGNEGHTNIKGAEKISEYIIEQYKKIYK